MRQYEPLGRLAGRLFLVIDPHVTGHHLRTIAWIVTELLNEGASVLMVTGEEALQSENCAEIVAHPRLKFVAYDRLMYSGKSQSSGVRNRTVPYLNSYFEYQKLTRQIELLPEAKLITDIFFLFIDQFAYAMALQNVPKIAGARTWGMLYRPHFSPENGRAKNWVRGRLLRTILTNSSVSRIFAVEGNQELSKRVGLPGACKIVNVHDAMDPPRAVENHLARQFFGIRDGMVCLLVYGALSERKSIKDAIGVATAIKNVFLLIVGKPDLDTVHILEGDSSRALVAENRCVIRPDYVDNEIEGAAFSAADVVWVAYKRFSGSSGVMIQAGLCGKALIGNNHGIIGDLILKYIAGIVVNLAGPPEAIVNECRPLFEDAVLRSECSLRSKDAFADKYGPDRLTKTLVETFLQRVN